MFAICSVPEFKPEKICVNHYPEKDNKPVNLTLVRTFYKSKSFVYGAKNKDYFTIVFEYSSSDNTCWYFHDEEERNLEYSNLLYNINKNM